MTTYAASTAVLLMAGGARASANPATEASCTVIDALPYEIADSGRYCLEEPLATAIADGAAITVRASDVTIDLRGFSITSTLRRRQKRVVGILARDQKNLTIRGGRIQGFRYGILITDSAAVSSGHRISRVAVNESLAAGIVVTGASSTIEDCLIAKTGGAGSYAAGISHSGALGVIQRNWILDTSTSVGGGYAAGIDLVQGPWRSVRNNHVHRVSGPGLGYGIRCGKDFSSPRFGNLVEDAAIPFSDCNASPSPSPNPYPSPYPSSYPSPYPGFAGLEGSSANGQGQPRSAGTLGLSALAGLLVAAGMLASKQFSA